MTCAYPRQETTLRAPLGPTRNRYLGPALDWFLGSKHQDRPNDDIDRTHREGSITIQATSCRPQQAFLSGPRTWRWTLLGQHIGHHERKNHHQQHRHQHYHSCCSPHHWSCHSHYHHRRHHHNHRHHHVIKIHHPVGL